MYQTGIDILLFQNLLVRKYDIKELIYISECNITPEDDSFPKETRFALVSRDSLIIQHKTRNTTKILNLSDIINLEKRTKLHYKSKIPDVTIYYKQQAKEYKITLRSTKEWELYIYLELAIQNMLMRKPVPCIEDLESYTDVSLKATQMFETPKVMYHVDYLDKIRTLLGQLTLYGKHSIYKKKMLCCDILFYLVYEIQHCIHDIQFYLFDNGMKIEFDQKKELELFIDRLKRQKWIHHRKRKPGDVWIPNPPPRAAPIANQRHFNTIPYLTKLIVLLTTMMEDWTHDISFSNINNGEQKWVILKLGLQSCIYLFEMDLKDNIPCKVFDDWLKLKTTVSRLILVVIGITHTEPIAKLCVDEINFMISNPKILAHNMDIIAMWTETRLLTKLEFQLDVILGLCLVLCHLQEKNSELFIQTVGDDIKYRLKVNLKIPETFQSGLEREIFRCIEIISKSRIIGIN